MTRTVQPYARGTVQPGRPRAFQTPAEMWQRCCDYFDWVATHPLYKEQRFSYQGKVIRASVAKLRAMTRAGLCLHLGIGQQTWRDYRTRDAFSEVTTRVEYIIHEYQLTGAAAGLLNPNIIARELGLRDKVDNTHDGGDRREALLHDIGKRGQTTPAACRR